MSIKVTSRPEKASLHQLSPAVSPTPLQFVLDTPWTDTYGWMEKQNENENDLTSRTNDKVDQDQQRQASSSEHLTQTAEWQEFVAGYPVTEHVECLRKPGQIFSELGYRNKTLRAAAIDLSFEISAKARGWDSAELAFDDKKDAICHMRRTRV
ncbi:hypothetical protein BDD12DRAFT_891841 [Trichophaea hybrida]|nr:hypothetical protein BDD12DRAFT_891841 [Trichophaea hybrida]